MAENALCRVISRSRNRTFCSYLNEITQTPGPDVRAPLAIIDDETQFYISLFIIVIFSPLVSVLGLVTNLINMLVFARTGLRDCMSVSLYCVAFVEVFLSACTLTWGISYIGALFYPKNPIVDYNGVFYLAAIISKFFKMASILLTVFISLERCLCVVWPLRFKNVFTVRRSLVVIAVQFTIVALVALPRYQSMLLNNRFDPAVNGTRLVLDLISTPLDNFSLYAENMVIGIGSQGAILVFTLMTALGLRRSMRFRRKTARKHFRQDRREPDTKELRLTRMMLALATVFLVLRLPDIACALFFGIQADLGLGLGQQQNNLFITLAIFMYLPPTVSASANLFIYYTMSTEFRHTFRRVFHLNLVLVLVAIDSGTRGSER